MTQGLLGCIRTPKQGNLKPNGAVWCADNGVFGNSFNERSWWNFLVRWRGDVELCKFAVAPDVVADSEATLERSKPWLAKIRELGYPVALAAQDGMMLDDVPWSDIDALFIGGSSAWKDGHEAKILAKQAKALDKWVHMGRVNGFTRYLYARSISCDSVDGTFLTYAPDINLARLLRWIDRTMPIPAEDTLFPEFT